MYTQAGSCSYVLSLIVSMRRLGRVETRHA
jgi:hypothetical protein